MTREAIKPIHIFLENKINHILESTATMKRMLKCISIQNYNKLWNLYNVVLFIIKKESFLDCYVWSSSGKMKSQYVTLSIFSDRIYCYLVVFRPTWKFHHTFWPAKIVKMKPLPYVSPKEFTNNILPHYKNDPSPNHSLFHNIHNI